ncbi:MAG TPA: type II secretion system protein GspE [Proteobacteria bacterium]|nr:type II secretion system protein GspE [Pseudomonadota bacterium]
MKGRTFSERLSEALVERGLLTIAQAEEANLQMERMGTTLEEALLRLNTLGEAEILAILGDVSGVPFADDLSSRVRDEDVERRIPIQYARKHFLYPFVDAETGEARVAVNQLDHEVLENVSVFLGAVVKPVLSTRRAISEAINLTYERSSDSADMVIENLDNGDLAIHAGEFDEPQDLLDSSDEAPIISFVNSLLYEAVRRRASDIHIEPFEGDLSVRYRVDGVLHNVHSLPQRLHSSIISRVKVMADLDIAEKRLPQDGRIRIKIAGKDIDIRVSIVPTRFGERGVLRLLDRSQVLLGLEEIGMGPEHLSSMERIVHSSHGITLVTGPTGSGKTTTLYGALTRINSADRNIITVEDPVEYQLRGISQIQVNPKIDLTFANGLRSILRQDPNVIMVGEIRDLETAEIAIQASLTGHLVLSTLHTNDAAGAVTRLIDMGVEPFLVASSVTAILAQRLVRKICPHCVEQYAPLDEELAELGWSQDDIPEGRLHQGAGCDQCLGTGYIGRTGIYELLLVTDRIKTAVLKNPDSGTVYRIAIEEGMRTIRQDGARKVLDGVTTVEEILRVTQEESGHAPV